MSVSYNEQVYPIFNPPVDPPYIRPVDWLPLPALADGEEKFAGLFPVFDDKSNFLAIYFEGDYTVDWGDGTTQNFASGVTAEHTYDYDSLSLDTLTARGYKQVVVTVVPQTGQTLSYMDLSVVHTNFASSSNISCPWLDIVLGMPNAGPAKSIIFCDDLNNNYLGSLENVAIYDTGGCEDMTYGFYYCTSLKQAVVKSMPQMQVIDYLFSSCSSLKVAILPVLPPSSYGVFETYSALNYIYLGDISNVLDDPGDIFNTGDYLKEIVIGKVGQSIYDLSYDADLYYLETFTILDASLLEDAGYAFENCYSLRSVNFPPTPNLKFLNDAFEYCYALTDVQFTDLSEVTDISYLFEDCYSLVSVDFPPMPLVEDCYNAFETCTSLESVTLRDFPSLSSLTFPDFFDYVFYDCPNLKEVNLIGFGENGFTETFNGCDSLSSLDFSFPLKFISVPPGELPSLAKVTISDTSKLKGVDLSFSQSNLSRVDAPGISCSFTIQNSFMPRESIVSLFGDLSIVTPGSRKVCVSNTPGTANLTPADYQIATDKGWVIETNLCSAPPYFCSTTVDTYCISDFSNAWNNCTGLTSLPGTLDFRNGVIFDYAWYNCTGLTSFPGTLDFSSAEFFSFSWYNCTGLTSFPGTLDFSSGTIFPGTWMNCSNLTSFPGTLNFSSGIYFGATWYNCRKLTSFPLLDVSSGISFQETWGDCRMLTSFPLLNVSSGTDFYRTWYNCFALTSFPALTFNTNVESFFDSWRNCSALTTFPANMFNNTSCLDFSGSWVGCALNQTSVDNILVSINMAGTSNGTLHIFGGTSAAPGAPGLAAKAALIARGWTVITN